MRKYRQAEGLSPDFKHQVYSPNYMPSDRVTQNKINKYLASVEDITTVKASKIHTKEEF